MMTSVWGNIFLVILLTAVMMKSTGLVLDNDENDETFYKRSTCKDRLAAGNCQWYKNKGYCSRNSRYYASMARYCPAICGICKPVKPVTPVGNGVEQVSVNINECRRAHNSKRALHGASPLSWDPVLARQAQAYAMKMAQSDNFDHDPNRGRVGENLQKFSVRLQNKDCKEAVEEWYSEVTDYPFSSPPLYLRGGYGHFTQVVWKSTTHFGVGIARNRFYVYIVARYSPPGNVYKQFAENVGYKRG